MKKKILVILSMFLILFTLTGCILKPKKAITGDKFIEVAKNNNLTVIDAYEQMSQYGVIQTALLAKAADGWQIEFYILNTDSDAKDMYETNRKIFEDSKGSSSKEKYLTLKNYSMYNLVSGGRYMYLSKIDNTLLYVRIDDKYTDNVKKIVKELGY